MSWFWSTGFISVENHLLEPPALPPCLVQPLSELTDVQALAFENGRTTAAAVDTAGLTPAASLALLKFESIVTSAGGTLTLTSAYRPPAYQAHLQEVWDKWMGEFRDLQSEQCQDVRADVEREFREHGLLETQRPASISDHSSGLAFDAVVSLPRFSAKKRRRITADTLARRAGLFRPVRFQDPVHFRLVTTRKKTLRTRVANRRHNNRVREQV